MNLHFVDESTRATHTVPPGRARVVVGRAPECDMRVADPGCSRQQLALHVRPEGILLEPLSTNVPTQVDGQRVQGSVPLRAGSRVQFGASTWTLVVPIPVSRPNAGGGAGPRDGDRTLPAEVLAAGGDADGTILLGGGTGQNTPDRILLVESGTIGRARACRYLLEHPMVSRTHAELRIDRAGTAIRDAGSANGTFVNGERVRHWVGLAAGDRVDIGPFSLLFDGQALIPESRKGNLRIVAHGLERRVPHPDKTGEELTILSGVDLRFQPREFIALIGPSGSGKSTLMNALSARAPASAGRVLVNGVDLYSNFESLKESIAMVPQEEALHASLTVRDAVGFTAKLRLPPDTEASALRDAVTNVITASSLTSAHAEKKVRELSGGQRKRASLANETVHDPSLLFVDEVTSGLDEETDAEIMRLLRSSADAGRTVICVTHTLANVEEFCHKIVVMAVPGVLAFYGSPAECLEYFGIRRLSDVYKVLKQVDGAELQRRYRASEYFRAHVGDTKVDVHEAEATAARAARVGKTWKEKLPESWRQLQLLVRRSNRLLLADKEVLTLAIAQCLSIGAVLSLVFHGIGEAVAVPEGWEAPAGESPLAFFARHRALVFMLGVSCFWFGTSNASKEIVKERLIYSRERDVNLQIPSYVAAKIPGLGLLGLTQALVLFLITALFIPIPGSSGILFATMAMAVLCGTCLGLIISAMARTPDQATTLVPIFLIPQIVLSGVIVPDMSGFAETVAQLFVSGYWIVQGVEPRIASEFSGAHEYPGVTDLLVTGAILGLHGLVFAVGAIAVMIRRDTRGGARYGAGVQRWIVDGAKRALGGRAASGTRSGGGR